MDITDTANQASMALGMKATMAPIISAITARITAAFTATPGPQVSLTSATRSADLTTILDIEGSQVTATLVDFMGDFADTGAWREGDMGLLMAVRMVAGEVATGIDATTEM